MASSIGRNGDRGESEGVEALLQEAEALWASGRPEEALEPLEQVATQRGDAAEPDVRASVARAVYWRAGVLRDLGRAEEALAGWTELWNRFGDDPPAQDPLLPAHALYAKAQHLWALGRGDEALAVCDQLIGLYGEDQRLDARLLVADGLGVKRAALTDARDYALAAEVNDELLARLDVEAEPALRSRAADALQHRVWLQPRASRSMDEAIGASQALLDMFKAETDPDLICHIGESLLAVASNLNASNGGSWPTRLLLRTSQARDLDRGPSRTRQEQALRILGEVSARFRDSSDPGLVRQAARAQIRTAEVLGRLGRLPQAVTAYEAAFAFGPAAVSAFEELAARTQRSSRPASAAYLASALSALDDIDDSDAAVAAIDELIERFRDEKSLVSKVTLAVARRRRANLIDGTGS